MEAVINDPVKVRFIIQEINKRDWEELYSKMTSTYIPIWRKQTLSGYKTGAKVLVKLADVGNWREDYLGENGGYKCAKCEDTGVNYTIEKNWLPCQYCSFGNLVKKHYNKSKVGR